MDESLVPRRISKEAIPGALAKAERYRLLNDPEPAESIYLDVLAVDPDNLDAVIALILSYTDQFQSSGTRSKIKAARDLLSRIPEDYDRHYYAGLIEERLARAFLAGAMTSSFAYSTFRAAMVEYEKADALKPSGNDEAILRWNSCVRTINAHDLHERPETAELPAD